ncbi:hypothetical protein BDQ17DRAFT_385665 [Cyathus striatus]|nr:hypothetical protein BDQ17DRAFT_385665 [Cyathus striatus]
MIFPPPSLATLLSQRLITLHQIILIYLKLVESVPLVVHHALLACIPPVEVFHIFASTKATFIDHQPIHRC